MTRKEWMQAYRPEEVDERWSGGVYCCPYSYPALLEKDPSATETMNCNCAGKQQCEACWNTEIPNYEEKEKPMENLTNWHIRIKLDTGDNIDITIKNNIATSDGIADLVNKSDTFTITSDQGCVVVSTKHIVSFVATKAEEEK